MSLQIFLLCAKFSFPLFAVSKVASFFANWKGRRTVVVSRGPEPLLLAKAGCDSPLLFPVPALDTPLLDSVGCGDALAGAFLALFIRTGNPEKAVQAGIVAAAEIARSPGCDPPIKTMEELQVERNETMDSTTVKK